MDDLILQDWINTLNNVDENCLLAVDEKDNIEGIINFLESKKADSMVEHILEGVR